MFAQAMESILKDHCTPQTVRSIEAGASADALYAAIADAGFLELLAAEADGGAGATMQELFPVLSLCGAYAVPLPLAQTLAARLLASTHADLPSGAITIALALVERGGDLVCPQVPCARVAAHVIAAKGNALWLLPVATARVDAIVPGSLAATLRWSMSDGVQLRSAMPASSLAALGAVLHAAMLSGACKRVFDMTLQYGNDRLQFGKSIGKFQTVQHQLSLMAEHVAAASIAAQAAFDCGARAPSLLASAVAKSRTSEAAQVVSSIAHSVHGAIGVTAEYDLQLFTRRLHEWRMAHGSEAHWNRLLGEAALNSGEALLTDFVRGVVA